MTTPDVRYRLSVEGEQAIISAFAAIQAKAESTGKAMSGSFGSFGVALGGVQRLLGALGIAVGVGSLIAIGKSAAASAEDLTKMAQRLGTTTQNMTVLSLAAKLAGVDLSAMTQGLSKFTLATQQAASGAGGPAASALRAIGLSSKEIKGLLTQDLAERIATISQKFATIPDSAAKSAAALQLVGGRGAALIPVFNLLGTMGFDRVKKYAEDMGAMIDGPALESIVNMNQHARLLSVEMQSLAVDFMAAASPDIVQAFDAIGVSVAGTAVNVKAIADVIAFPFKVILGVVLDIGIVLGGLWKALIQLNEGMFQFAGRIAHLDVKGAAAAFEVWGDKATATLIDMNKRGTEVWKTLFNPPTKVPKPPGGDDSSRLEELFNQKLAAQTSRLNSQLAVLKAKSALLEQADKTSFDAALIDVREYYARRTKIVNDNAAAEIAVLRKRMATELQDPNTQAGAIAAAKTKSEIAQKELTSKADLLRLQDEERKEVQHLGDEWNAVVEKTLELQGKRHDAAMLQLETEYRKAVENAAKLGPLSAFGPVQESYRTKMLEQYQAARKNAIDLAEVSQQANFELNDYTQARTAIERLASAGLISEGDATNRILKLDDQRIASLEEVAAHMRVVAAESGDPEQIQKAAAISASVDEIRISMDAARDSSAQLKVGFQDALGAGVNSLLTDGIRNAKTWGDVWRTAGLAALDVLDRMIAKLLQLKFASFLAGLFKTGASAGIPGGGGDVSGAVIGATGGLLRGPGTGTSDSIVARVSTGEYITRAAIVAQPGMLQHLAAINQLGLRALSRSMPRFAEGGLVASAPPRYGGEGRLTVGLEPGLVVKELHTPEGMDGIVRVVADRRKAIKRAIG